MGLIGYLLLLALSLDTLVVAMGLARHGPALRTVLALALAEALAPLLGYALGSALIGLSPRLGNLGAAALLLLLGLHLLREAGEEDDESERLAHGSLLLGAVAVALDELGVGVALPAVHLSPLPAVLWLLVQAPAMALLGLRLGARLTAHAALRHLPGGMLVALGLLQGMAALGVLHGTGIT